MRDRVPGKQGHSLPWAGTGHTARDLLTACHSREEPFNFNPGICPCWTLLVALYCHLNVAGEVSTTDHLESTESPVCWHQAGQRKAKDS